MSYQFQSSGVICDVFWKQNEHAELIINVWKLKDCDHQGFYEENSKFVLEEHHLHRL